ncbi:MAG: vWA domain-containing protein [Spirochaetaceae bacterium]
MESSVLLDVLGGYLPEDREAQRLVALAVERLSTGGTANASRQTLECIAAAVGPLLSRLWKEGYGEPDREVELRIAPLAPLTRRAIKPEQHGLLRVAQDLIESLPPGRGATGCGLDLARLETDRTPLAGRLLYRRLRCELLEVARASARRHALVHAFHRLRLPLGMLKRELPRYLEFIGAGGPHWPLSSFGWSVARGRWYPVDWHALHGLLELLSREPTVERLCRRVSRFSRSLYAPVSAGADPLPSGEIGEGAPPPISLVLDTSGSMRGEGERVSRALLFGLLVHAGGLGRPVRLLYAGSRIQQVAFPPENPDLPTLVSELDHAFASGGSPIPALREALKDAVRRREDLAEILLVTDSREPRLSQVAEEQLTLLRSRSSLILHGLTVGELPLINENNLFDYTWHYASSRTLRPGIASEQFKQL